MGDLLDNDNAVDLTKARQMGVLALVKELEETEIYGKDGEVVRVKRKAKLYDAQSALTDILKMHGRFVDRLEHSGGQDITITRRIIGADES